MAAKVNSKSCQTSETELFPQVVTGFRDELRMLPNIKDRSLCKNSQKLKIVHYFLQKPPSWMFDKVLNMFLKN